jgi:hypothetical protein
LIKYIEPVQYYLNEHSLIGEKLLIAQCAFDLESKNTTLYVTNVDPDCSSTYKLSQNFMKIRPV